MNEYKQFDKTRTLLKELPLEEFWKENESKGIRTLFLIYPSDNILSIGFAYEGGAYETIKEIECDTYSFAVVLTFVINNPFFNDKDVMVECGSFR